MTGFLTLCVGIALIVPLLTRGSYEALLKRRWRWQLTFAAGFALQAASERLPHPRGHDFGFGALLASYILLLAFCARNFIRTGMALVFIGIAMNTATIAINHGMPVRVPQRWAQTGGLDPTVKHHAADRTDTTYWLSDVIYLPATDEVISFGDLVLAIGLIDVSFHASRRRRSRVRRDRSVAPRPKLRTRRPVRTPIDLDSLSNEASIHPSAGWNATYSSAESSTRLAELAATESLLDSTRVGHEFTTGNPLERVDY